MRRVVISQDVLEIIEAGLSVIGCDFMGDVCQCFGFGSGTLAGPDSHSEDVQPVPHQSAEA